MSAHRLSRISPAHASPLAPLIVSVGDDDLEPSVSTIEEFSNGFRDGDAAALAAVQAAIGEGREFERVYQSHPANFLPLMIHDAHHRGQVMSLLRRSGRTAEEMGILDDATWPIWRE